jgi:phenylalanine-4-hydroxylase
MASDGAAASLPSMRADHERSDAPVPHAGGLADLVVLDPDHPGFRDRAYRERRNAIARLALDHRPGGEVVDAPYSADEHGVWRHVWLDLEPLHRRWACREYLDGSAAVALDRERIPQLRAINDVIAPATGFRMLPVAGLVSARRFLEHLGRGEFLSTQYIRHHSRPLYTPEPDVVHELIGHAATFVRADYADLNRAFGAAAQDADDARLTALERVYWYTLEFGLVREAGAVKAYGAGLLSGAGELGSFADRAELRPFDLEAMAARPYDPTRYQPVLFVAESFGELGRVREWLEDG